MLGASRGGAMAHPIVGLGRVGVVQGEEAARAARIVREIARAGQATVAVPIRLQPGEPVENALREAKVDSAWLGPAPLRDRAAFARACIRAGATHVGPPADVLAQLSDREGIARLAAQIGAPLAVESHSRARLFEIVVARDHRGSLRALGVGDASLRFDGRAVLVESPPALLTENERREARDLAARACEATGWTGICAVRLLLFPAGSTSRWSLAGLDCFADAAPAIEAVASVDFVRLAFQIAAGVPLGDRSPVEQGHAFAARIIARDPESEAIARPGPVEVLAMPSGPGLRADVEVRHGQSPEGPGSVLVTLVSHGAGREEASQRLQEALAEGDLLLRGSGTSKAWLRALAGRPEIAAGETSIGLLDRLASSGKLVEPRREAALLAAAIEAYHAEEDLERARFLAEARRGRPRVGPSSGRAVELTCLGRRYRLEVRQLGPNEYRVESGLEAPAAVRLERLGRFEQRLEWQGLLHRVFLSTDGLRQLVQVDDVAHLVSREPAGIVAAPMPAVVAAIQVEVGQQVAPGDPLVRIESMKVQVEVTAPAAGTVREILVAVNGQVDAGAPLSPAFVALLRPALAQYRVSMDAPGRDLELALLRIQKSRERVGEQPGPIASILERWLASDDPLPAEGGTSRETLDRLVDLGHERFPAVADLAREARYRNFDKPALDRVRAETLERAQSDLARLPDSSGDEREAILDRLVACTQPISTTLISHIAATESPALRARLVETLVRRYYRFRALERVASSDVEGIPCAWVDYELRGVRYRLFACSAPAAGVSEGARKLARLASDVPQEREILLDLYLGEQGPRSPPDQVADSLRDVLLKTSFARPPRRISTVVAGGLREGRRQSPQHFTFRSGPGGWREEGRSRGAHSMRFDRLQLARLAKFDLSRLPSADDLYLYRGVAESNPKDERLFAMAEVRDLTPVRDAAGHVIELPELERILHEALGGMRVHQAQRAPHERMEWNRVQLTLTPPLDLPREEVERIAARLAPATEGLGLEMVSLTARVPDPGTGQLRETLLRVVAPGQGLSIRRDEPTEEPLQPMSQYQQKVVQLRRRGLVHPFELVRMLAQPAGVHAAAPPGEFVEYDLDASNALVPVQRPPGSNTANVVVGVVRNFTRRYPEGMERVVLLGDPGREMGSVAEPECRRIAAALDLAEKLRAPVEWFEVCAGAKISMTSGTENMDWVSRVLRRIIEFTQRGGEINVVVLGIAVGAQPYWNAEATMLMHTKGILVMAPGSTMVLTGKQALEYSGSVSAEDNEGIGGYDRIMGPNGQAQYRAGSVSEALQILLRHYDHCYVAPGERFPRRAETADPRDRDVRDDPHGPEGGAGFATVGEIFSVEHNPDRKEPFEIRKVMGAAIDRDFPPLERWRDLRGGETAVVWDAHLGGWPVCLIGIQSRPLPRLEFVPADGPELWSAGTLFPQSSKKIARAVNSASGNRPLVILANLSGFDGSPESMRRLQLEYGAEIGRAVVNFQGPIAFCVVSRYHGGAFVVFARTLTESIEIVAIEGARASVIGGAPAAAVVLSLEVEARTGRAPRLLAAE